MGNTGIRVSRLCFGTLTIGPLQANLPVGEGARLLTLALDKGVNFIDTAELYGTYPYIRRAIRNRPDTPVIASKSYAYTRAGMKESLARALDELDLPVIDIFLLHEQESHLTLAGHREALDYLLEAKKDRLVRAVGFSCHTVAALRAALMMPDIDVVHPLVNIKGIGIRDGTAAEMLDAIAALHKIGVGVYSMKPLGGGHLSAQNDEALLFVRSHPALDAVAVGMATTEEVEYNTAFFAGSQPDLLQTKKLRDKNRRLHIHDWCTACGQCIPSCPQSALLLKGGSAAVDEGKCILCGYCGAVCPDFCLKIF